VNQAPRLSEAVRTALDEHLIEWVLRTPLLVEEVFDSLPDVLFYIKDSDGRYLWVNATLVERSGLGLRDDVIGKTADQIFTRQFKSATQLTPAQYRTTHRATVSAAS